jgi:hypothetical protein
MSVTVTSDVKIVTPRLISWDFPSLGRHSHQYACREWLRDYRGMRHRCGH